MTFLPSPGAPVVLIPEKVVTDAEVYERAAVVVTKRGWNSGEWIDADGRVCTLGAIGVAAMELGHPVAKFLESDEHPFNEDIIVNIVASRIVGGGEKECELISWNDGLKRHPEFQVKRRLRKMAKEARKQEAAS